MGERRSLSVRVSFEASGLELSETSPFCPSPFFFFCFVFVVWVCDVKKVMLWYLKDCFAVGS